MRAADIPVDEEGARSLCRLLLRAADSSESALRPKRSEDWLKRPTLFERFDRWIAGGRQRDRERYLAQARDVFELEARIRTLERLPYY